MTRPLYRSAYASGALVVRVAPAALVALGVVLAGVGHVSLARAEGAPPDPELHASMQCDRASEPGRVRCNVEVRIEGGRTLAWADVELLSLPDFASALKGRIGPQDALSRDATSTKWALGLVARRAGQGEAHARVRVVLCAAGSTSRCAPATIDVRAQVTVGG
jgi:hypothetical protein